MILFITLVICFLFGLSLYTRNFPIRHVKCIDLSKINDNTIQIIDVRDYNDSYQTPRINALNIPIGYLTRYYDEISNKEIFIVASNKLEKNISIRFLRKKGFKIVGYSLTTCKCSQAI